MQEVYLLGIDIGTTKIKVGIFSLKGTLKSFATMSLEILQPKSNYSEVALTTQWGKLLQCLSIALKEAQVSPKKIKSIGISTLCPVFVALDAEGEPLRAGIIYSDQRSIKQKKINKTFPEKEFFNITGNRINPAVCSFSNMLWIKDNEPGIFNKTSIFGHIDTYLIYKLTGKFAIDWTNASFTGIYDIKKNIWSKELCALFGISLKKLPAIFAPITVVGGITQKISKLTGLEEGTPVIAGAADTACSALALGVTNNGQIFQTSGGSEVTSICSGIPRFDNRFANRNHIVLGKWLFHGAMSTGGTSLKWINEIFYPGLKETYRYRKMDKEARISSPGANGVIFLPYLSGERTPKWDPHTRGIFWGLTLKNNRSDMIRSVLEGVAYGMREIIEIIEGSLEIKVNEIGIVGGGAKNDLWNQIKADITQKKILRYKFHETALLGAALLGGIGVNIFSNYKEAITKVVPLLKIEKSYYPNSEIFFRYYSRNFRIYKSLYVALKNINQEL
ncbi:MAG: sugar kinase [Candidatus Nealsonbacteria bacterium]|nr:MAG: sugar kinase [Candidatus Nealsonbacteria bacterium]